MLTIKILSARNCAHSFPSCSSWALVSLRDQLHQFSKHHHGLFLRREKQGSRYVYGGLPYIVSDSITNECAFLSQPICNSYSTQLPVDLTGRSVYRIGRSPQSDVLLLHATSSRRHAMLFHHSNGSCYIVDCGSAHGTYVNGHRIKSAPNGRVVVPHKVRRGSIVRFGGPGAPEFMLKSFSFDLEDMRYPVSANPSLSPTSAATAIVQHNTRLNALGKTAKDSLFYSLSSKRSFDSVETAESDFESNRCTSPPLSPEQQPIRLVSPDIGQPRKRRRVHFSSEPPRAFYPNLISPDLSSDENDCDESH